MKRVKKNNTKKALLALHDCRFFFFNILYVYICVCRAHACCVSDDCGAHGMERNIGDQLNKAFEAYRKVSIEKDIAKKDLQKMVKMKRGYIFFHWYTGLIYIF